MTDEEKQTSNAFGYVPPEDGIGQRIKAKRIELDLKVEELARLTQYYDYSDGKKGIAASSIHRYESGAFKPAMREIRLLCDALEVSADWLIRGISHELNQETSLKAQAAEGFINAVMLLLQEDKNPFSKTNADSSAANWKSIERSEKLARAKNP